MASIRELNILGQQRWDIPQIRLIESAVRGDFDLLSGKILAGSYPLIIRGFTLSATTAGSPATGIQVVVANGIVTNINATESGSLYAVPADRANETLTSTNGRVIGSFTASATNYVGLDLRRTADDTTSDIVQFLNATTILETSRVVPLARTLDYKLIISSTDFSSQPNITPIAKVVTTAGNTIDSVVDARQLMYRLGQGGSFPDQFGSYGWPGGRAESQTALDMAGGDKSILSGHDWFRSVMTRLWEVGGGEFWYSSTADRNVTMVWTGPTFANGENFDWDGNDLTWQGINFLFDNSSQYFNTVADQTTGLPGLTDLEDGDCIYVDLDRRVLVANGGLGVATLIAARAPLITLGPGDMPGARYVIAWRYGADVYTRNWRYPVGTTFSPATTAAQGVVKISRDYLGVVTAGLSGLNDPIAISDRGGTITAVAATGHTGLISNGNGIGNGLWGVGGVTSATGVYGQAIGGNGDGVRGQGFGAGVGIRGIGGATGAGGNFSGGATSGVGVISLGVGSANGIEGTSGSTYGFGAKAGVHGTGAAAAPTGLIGVFGVGGAGLVTGGGGIGVFASGGGGTGVDQDGGDGVRASGGNGTGSGTGGFGGDFTGGASGVGVRGTGGANSDGVHGVGTGTGAGGVFDGAGTGPAVDIGLGYALFSGVEPDAITGFTNTQTAKNMEKCGGVIQLNSTTSPDIIDGFNIQDDGGGTVTCSTTTITITFEDPMADGGGGAGIWWGTCGIDGGSGGGGPHMAWFSTGSYSNLAAVIQIKDLATQSVQDPSSAGMANHYIFFSIHGSQ